jgi:hypothetical protein
VDPIHGVRDAADSVAGADRVLAVGAATRVPGGRRDGLTDDLCTGTGVGADAVVAPIARQVGDQAHIILADCHTVGIPALGEVKSAASRLLATLLTPSS